MRIPAAVVAGLLMLAQSGATAAGSESAMTVPVQDVSRHGVLQVLREAWDEGMVARGHLALALAEGADLTTIKHEVDAAWISLDIGASGPGLRPALAQAIRALTASSDLRDADGAQYRAAVMTALMRVDDALAFARAVQGTGSRKVAREAARGMMISLKRAMDGWDRNADGTLDWRSGEAGLQQALAGLEAKPSGIAGVSGGD